MSYSCCYHDQARGFHGALRKHSLSHQKLLSLLYFKSYKLKWLVQHSLQFDIVYIWISKFNAIVATIYYLLLQYRPVAWVSSRGVRRVKMLRVKNRAANARAARGSGGMLPREILKIIVLYNDFSCILSPLLYHFG